MFGGEIIVPKLPSIKIIDIIPLLGDDLSYHLTGIRPGEKIHEVMIPEEEIGTQLIWVITTSFNPITIGGIFQNSKIWSRLWKTSFQCERVC